MSKYSIELDCQPGNPRPDALLPSVLQGTGITIGDPVSKVFGNWMWVIPEEQEAAYALVQPVIRDRIKELYAAGAIRYGSW